MNANANTASDTKTTTALFMPGQMLKHFRLEALLGEGGMGAVYRAYDTRLHRPVAVKFLSSLLTAEPERRQRFIQEAQAAARINHPAIAQIFDVDAQADVTFIVMELVEGKTVRQLIEEQELDLLGTMDIAIQAAEGLAKAHELGIVHRDIKPANVMRTRDAHVKILDFGLAKLLGPTSGQGPAGTIRLDQAVFAQTRPGIVMGTPAYMSPEQVRGLPADPRTDIFALGVLLFEMATGKSPFQRDNSMDALHAAAFEEAPPMNSIRAHIPDDLQRIVSRCLRKRTEDRYPDARLLAEDLRRVRRDTESGLSHKISWQQRFRDLWEEVRHQPASRFVWYGLGLTAALWALYLSVVRIGTGGLVFLAVASLYLYRHVRNQPHRLQELFVQRVSKIPEVRLIVFRGREASVVVDRPVAQLYGRLNEQLSKCNRQIYFGDPLALTILHEVPSEQFTKMLAGSGVQYVREDVLSE